MESVQSSLVMVGASEIPKTWETLFARALMLISEIEKYRQEDPFWTLGGGTVLMLRYRHRFSKDIDIFVPDPQSLGFVTPRLSDVAESITPCVRIVVASSDSSRSWRVRVKDRQ